MKRNGVVSNKDMGNDVSCSHKGSLSPYISYKIMWIVMFLPICFFWKNLQGNWTWSFSTYQTTAIGYIKQSLEYYKLSKIKACVLLLFLFLFFIFYFSFSLFWQQGKRTERNIKGWIDHIEGLDWPYRKKEDQTDDVNIHIYVDCTLLIQQG